MRRDILLGSLGVIAASFFMFSNYYKANATYRKFDISPLLYKHDILPIDTHKVYKGLNDETLEKPYVYNPEYRVSFDLSGTQKFGGIEKYMELPLETDGKNVYTETQYQDVEETPIENPTFIKYIKFQFTSIRNLEKIEVKLGGFRFFQGRSLASTKSITVWDPHSGKREKYNGGKWSDSDQRTVIFHFSEPVLVDRYELKSSGDLIDFDPINWKIEGSMSGTYWTILDDRRNTYTAFPKERNKTMIYIMNRL